MIWKIFMGSLLAAFGAAALLLVTSTGAVTSTAEATVYSVTRSPGTISGGLTSNITIVADDGVDLRILATTGTVAAATGGCLGTDCTGVTGTGTSSLVIPDAGNDLKFVQVVYTGPSGGPATATVTVLQGASVRSVNINIRGAASEVQVKALNLANTEADPAASPAVVFSYGTPSANCAGSTANVISASGGDAEICALVFDSAGNQLAGETVVFTTTIGSLSAPSAVTGATGAISALTPASTGKAGTTATVQAWSSAKTATVDVRFGGSPSACMITTDPEVLEVGQTGKVSVSVTDSTGGPVPDGTAVTLASVSSVAGSTFTILNTAPSTSSGGASSTIFASVEGTIGVIATVGSKTCTAAVAVGGAAAPAPDTGMDVGFTGELPASGFALVTFTGSVEDLKTALATACPGGAPIYGSFVVDGVGSGLVPYFPTTTVSAVNAAFESAFAGGLSGTPLTAGNCGS